MINNILVALEGSAQSKRALQHAVEMCRHFSARLYLVNVLDTGHIPEELLCKPQSYTGESLATL